jgi:NADH:ubiquinone oxidoreductase subunit 5 (chain L)/Multisubunit Na+/H+ antiporter, MnhA subunit
MIDLVFLIVFPLIAAVLLLVVSKDSIRDALVKISALLIGIVSLMTLFLYYNTGALYFPVGYQQVSQIIFLVEVFLALFILYLGIKYRKSLAVVLILVQLGLLAYFEMFCSEALHAVQNLFIDQLSIIMALIIGIIGSAIAVYAVGYMGTYHRNHPEVQDRRRTFFFMVFLFISSMFGLVFSNNLIWVFLFWELTTVCSFILIGYSRSEEAVNNAFLALVMNLLGGIAFAGALIYLAGIDPSGNLFEINQLISAGQALAIVPAVLISFAGITKAALMPFSSWLVGAMVAPTPVSALLHSSTMVKAGVYIIVRFSPVLSGSFEGLIIAMIGGFTFLLASAIAISQSNAKKVLAYSTIANLGLIVACAGIGTYKLVWAAIMLIIFHAIAKSLLFLCVGTVENRIGSKDIEDMAGLIVRMPKIAVMMFIGIAGMFLAPFGMLISKWVAIEAFIDAPFGIIFVTILAFGGSITVLFWSKWMGKIISITQYGKRVEGNIRSEKWFVLYLLTSLTVLVCLIFPLISSVLIEPFVLSVYGFTTRLAQDNIMIMVMMLFLLMIMPLSMLFYRNGAKELPPYMGGRPTTPDMKFAGSMGIVRESSFSNYYFEQYCGESRLLMAGTGLCLGLILIGATLLLGVIV